MPPGIRIFLGYAFLILGAIGLSLRWVVDQAISVPISPIGVVAMVLLAYTIFTTTLVIQRKEASRTLALGLATLTVPAIPLLLLAAQPLFALIVAALAGAAVLRPHPARGPQLAQRALTGGAHPAGTLPFAQRTAAQAGGRRRSTSRSSLQHVEPRP